MKTPGPPRWAELLLGLLLPEQYRSEALGDLREGHAARAEEDPGAARAWYRRQLRAAVVPALRLRYRALKDNTNRTGQPMESLIQDLKYGGRSIRKNPLFAVVATLTLALAIGVNTTIFSLVSVLVFADLPMQDAETVAIIRGVNPELGVDQGSVSVPDFLDLRERAESFESLAALANTQFVLTGEGQPQRVRAYQATTNLLDQYRLPPQLGRDFAEGEDAEGGPRVAILGSNFWRSQFGGERDVLGRTLRLDGTEYTIIGVMSDKMNFADFSGAAVWVPLSLSRDGADREARRLFTSGRLKPGVTHAQATAEVDAIGDALASEYPVANAGWDLWSAPTLESLINRQGRTMMTLLVMMVGFVILIACANIANMLLARATARSREFAVRAALGAGRMRLIRQLLTESLIISLTAAALGWAFAVGLLEVLIRISNGTEQVFLMAEFDARVLLFTLVLAVAAPLFFGLFPALAASRTDASSSLRDARGSDGGRSGKRARGVLVGAQISLALALMIVSGLLVRTVQQLQARDLGFDPAGLHSMTLTLPQNGYDDVESRIRFFDRTLEELREIGGVQSAALTSAIPQADFAPARGIEIEGRPVAEGQARPPVSRIVVSPGYFDLTGIPLLQGRAFSREDGPESARVAIVARDVADRYWPDESPVGRRVRIGTEEADWLTIVGVADDVVGPPQGEGVSPRPAQALYLPFAQTEARSTRVIVEASAELGQIAGSLRSGVWAVDPNLPIDRLTTVEQALYDANASNYSILTLFVTFAIFALAMAAIGVYGVMSYSVSQRKGEFGLRMALGADRSRLRAMIVGQGVRIVGFGVAVGLVLGFLISRMLGGMVFGISATDPVTFIGVPAILIAVALVANLVPAIRATRTDPVNALRVE